MVKDSGNRAGFGFKDGRIEKIVKDSSAARNGKLDTCYIAVLIYVQADQITTCGHWAPTLPDLRKVLVLVYETSCHAYEVPSIHQLLYVEEPQAAAELLTYERLDSLFTVEVG